MFQFLKRIFGGSFDQREEMNVWVECGNCKQQTCYPGGNYDSIPCPKCGSTDIDRMEIRKGNKPTWWRS